MSHDPQHIIFQTRSDPSFFDCIYPQSGLAIAPSNPAFFQGRAIHTPRNDSVNQLNDILLNRMPGTTHVLDSYDTCLMDNEDFAHPDEISHGFMNSLNTSGLP